MNYEIYRIIWNRNKKPLKNTLYKINKKKNNKHFPGKTKGYIKLASLLFKMS